jgi:signal transduction histidine kinase
MDKSPNLKNNKLYFIKAEIEIHFDSNINKRAIRQAQVPLIKNGEIVGFIIAAMSSEAEISILVKLSYILVLSYILILIGLYFISRYLAGKIISPLKFVTQTITKISKKNLKERVELPLNKDEIYELSKSFNSLLDRLEETIEREKQFTSDASHELRTPLSVLRGTLEVLIRKPRTSEEYIDKIKICLLEIEKMANTIDQLLLLARLEIKNENFNPSYIPLKKIIEEALYNLDLEIQFKKIKINLDFDENKTYLAPNYYTNLIIDNILGNAIKYSNHNSCIYISLKIQNNRVICEIIDEGIGIKEDDLKNIYNSFFRSEPLNHKKIDGNGLGLSIVKKCIDAIFANIQIDSELGKGTKVKIIFNSIPIEKYKS